MGKGGTAARCVQGAHAGRLRAAWPGSPPGPGITGRGDVGLYRVAGDVRRVAGRQRRGGVRAGSGAAARCTTLKAPSSSSGPRGTAGLRRGRRRAATRWRRVRPDRPGGRWGGATAEPPTAATSPNTAITRHRCERQLCRRPCRNPLRRRRPAYLAPWQSRLGRLTRTRADHPRGPMSSTHQRRSVPVTGGLPASPSSALAPVNQLLAGRLHWLPCRSGGRRGPFLAARSTPERGECDRRLFE